MVGIQFVMTMAFSMLTPIMPLFLPELGVHSVAAIDIWAGILSGVTSFIRRLRLAALGPGRRHPRPAS